jgi:predicted nucleotidyltransferase
VDPLGRPTAEPRTILTALVDHDVEFLVIGGIAVILHGHTRTTVDVDIVPSPDAANISRLASALKQLDAAAVDDRGNRIPIDFEHPEGLSVGNYFLTTRAGGLDLLNGPRPDLLRFRRLAERAETVRLGGLPLKVIGLDDLIAMKREAGRDKDLRDIAALTELQRLRHAERDDV